jgi:hypothetical protein
LQLQFICDLLRTGVADILSLAQDLYDEATEDDSLLGEYKSEKRALLAGIRAGTGTGDVVSGTKNGASYTRRVGFSVEDRLSALRYAIAGIESATRPGHTSRVFFT